MSTCPWLNWERGEKWNRSQEAGGRVIWNFLRKSAVILSEMRSVSGIGVGRWHDLKQSHSGYCVESILNSKSERKEIHQRGIAERRERAYSWYQSGGREDGKKCSDSEYVSKLFPHDWSIGWMEYKWEIEEKRHLWSCGLSFRRTGL